MTPEVARQLEERKKNNKNDESVFPPGEEGDTVDTSGDDGSTPTGLRPEV
jgi:hypothetical protein